MGANFTPTFGTYSPLTPFRYWCQKVLPLVYDDSLSYYECLNKVVDYLNKTMEDVETLHGDTEAMLAAFNSLQTYVNTYFDELNLTEEVQTVLDRMAENGSLDELLRPLVGEQIGGVVAEQIDDAVAGQIYDAVAGQIGNAIASALNDGTYIQTAVTAWLGEHVDPNTGYVIDNSLSIEGAAADAKAVGDALSNIAPTFDASTAYTAEMYVLYNNVLYQFTADHAAGAWTGTDATAVKISQEVGDLKTQFDYLKDGYDVITYDIINDEYVTIDGDISPFTNWSRSDYIPVTPGEIIYYDNAVASGYNAYYNSDTSPANKSVSLAVGTGLTFVIPENVAFLIVSNKTAGLNELILYRAIPKIIADETVSDDTTWSSQKIKSITDGIDEKYDEILSTGVKRTEIDLDWEVGGIDNNGNIDTSSNQYYHTRKIFANEINSGVVHSNVTENLYAYKYRADGSYIFGYITIGKVDTYNVPADFLGEGQSVRFVMINRGYSTVTATGFEEIELKKDIDKLNAESTEVPKVVMLDKLVALEGEEFDIHYDNIFVNYRGKDIAYKELFGNVSGIGMEDLIRLQSNTVGKGVTGSIRYRKDITSAFSSPSLLDNVLKKSISVDTISLTSGSGVTRKVLLIGDSWTAPGKYARELRTLFESADEPMNITLLGTLGNGGEYVGPENGYHEGHGAYSAKTYCTKSTYNTYANAFYNPNTETFDFSYYMNNCGYSSVDDVFINLGINDVTEMQDFDEIISYWDIMINSIKAFDSNIRVFVGLCGLPAQYKYGVQNNNNNRTKARRLLFHERLISEYGNRENEKIIIVPLHLSIDSEHDFPTEQRARSFRDSTLVDYCTDYVHPSNIAYNKIADRIRTYIKYAETLT